MAKVLKIETCEGCPHFDIDNSEEEKKWGKWWCDMCNKELKSTFIPNWCPLPDYNEPTDPQMSERYKAE